MDLVFLLDGSGSVRKSGFQKIKTFTKTVGNRFFALSPRVHIGIVQYSQYFVKLRSVTTYGYLRGSYLLINFTRWSSWTNDRVLFKVQDRDFLLLKLKCLPEGSAFYGKLSRKVFGRKKHKKLNFCLILWFTARKDRGSWRLKFPWDVTAPANTK